jgi:hypothetical protein
MKRTLIQALLISAALVATAPAFAAEYAQAQATADGAKTRAEVKAELAAARRNGDLDAVNINTYPQLLPYQQRHAQIVAMRAQRTQ